MVASQNYNTVINQTSADVEQERRNVSFIFNNHILGSIFSSIFSSRQEKFKKVLNYQLAVSSWLISDITKNAALISGTDFTLQITTLSKLIESNISLEAQLERIYLINKDETIQLYRTVLNETIDNLYTCLRLFKKATKKQPLDERTTDAVNAVKRTRYTLNSIYGH